MAVGGGITERHLLAIGSAKNSRTLNMGNVYLKWVSKPGDFLTFEHSGLVDLAAVGIGFDGTIGEFLAEDVTLVVFDQVGGLFVKRIFVFPRWGKRPVKNRGVVAGVQDGSPVVAANGLVKLKSGTDGGVQFFTEKATVKQLGHRTQ